MQLLLWFSSCPSSVQALSLPQHLHWCLLFPLPLALPATIATQVAVWLYGVELTAYRKCSSTSFLLASFAAAASSAAAFCFLPVPADKNSLLSPCQVRAWGLKTGITWGPSSGSLALLTGLCGLGCSLFGLVCRFVSRGLRRATTLLWYRLVSLCWFLLHLGVALFWCCLWCLFCLFSSHGKSDLNNLLVDTLSFHLAAGVYGADGDG